jgi:aconitate hydratase
MAMAGEPFYFEMPSIWGVRLSGKLPPWVSAKDVILEMLRRHGVDGGLGRIIEYCGPGVQSLSAMDRHVIANMGTELGALTSVFPSDKITRRFLRAQGRENHWKELKASDDAQYDVTEEIDLSSLEPLIAMPSSPGNVFPVHEVAGEEIHQSYIGSSANPGYRDFAVVAEIFKDRHTHENVSLDINPASRQILENLVRDGHILSLIQAGARIHQAGCNGCIGMGQAPATDRISLRTVPRNFPGRSGTREDKVCLVSPETAAASALTGVISDPRTLDQEYPEVSEPEELLIQRDLLRPPPDPPLDKPLAKGPNIVSLPAFDALADQFELPVLLKVGDDISTDEIMPAGGRVLPFRSNIPEISQFVYEGVDESYVPRAREASGGHCIVGGANYGQGSSREHAALAPRYLGLRVVLAKGFARIHRQNLVNFGILPLQFADKDDYGRIETGERILIRSLREQMNDGRKNLICVLASNEETVETLHNLSDRQVEILLAGGLVNWLQQRLSR